MAEHVDDLTVTYEEDGKVLVEELGKEVLTKGAWATIIYRYRDMDRTSGEPGPEKVTIRRYKKMSGNYRPQSKFNISGAKQARQIARVLSEWYPEEG